MSARFVTVWEFVVRSGAEAEFERVYGPAGEWVALFRRGQGYLRSDLNRDLNHARRYLVFDHWDSREAYEDFRVQHKPDYDALDLRCEGLTERETPLGYFTAVVADA